MVSELGEVLAPKRSRENIRMSARKGRSRQTQGIKPSPATPVSVRSAAYHREA